MLIGTDASGEIAERLDPSTLQEEGCPHVEASQFVEDPRGVVAVVWTIGMLGVEGQRHPRSVGHFSTPVMTMPRMKAR